MKISRGRRVVWLGLAYLANLPLYWVSRVTPRRKEKWIFGAWLGRRYADNARFLFEHVNNVVPDVEPVWIAADREVVREVRRLGWRAYRSGSLLGYWHTATAGLAVVSSGTADVNRYVCPPLVLNVWHGTGLLKRIEFDSPGIAERLQRRRKVARLFPFHEFRDFSVLTSSSEREAEQWASAFRLPRDRVVVTGQSRNDSMAVAAGAQNAEAPQILYAPTFRDHDPCGPVRLLEEAVEELAAFLDAADSTLHVRLHPNSPVPRPDGWPHRIRFDSELCTTGDVSFALRAADLLVTDYSSIWVDYLLLRRPIAFLAYDLESYQALERDFYIPYGDSLVTPGPQFGAWSTLLAALMPDLELADFALDRAAALNAWHCYTDGSNSERIVELGKRVSGWAVSGGNA